MAKKQYCAFIEDRKAFDGTKFPDVKSPTFKTRRNAEKWMYVFDILDGKTCGGTATTYVDRVR